MNSKDKINKITGITSICTLIVIVIGQLIGNESLLGFPNAMLLYVLMPSALIWFGTRKNGCGSCNQVSSMSETIKDKKSREIFDLIKDFTNRISSSNFFKE